MKTIIQGIIIAVLAIGFFACKEDPKNLKKPTKTTFVKKEIKADTTKIDSAAIVKPKKVVTETLPPKPEDKYFLIAGSFQSIENAEIFKAQLVEEGFDAQVIERASGPNVDFYKVAYKSFYDKTEALAALRTARNVEMKNDVWLLVKR